MKCWSIVFVCACGVAGLLAPPVAAQDCVFTRGNIVNLEPGGEVVVDLNDAVDLVAYMFIARSAPVSGCPDAADVNDDGLVTVADYTYLVEFLFNDGPPPPPPFETPGADTTPDVTVPDGRDSRFTFSIGTNAGVPSHTGITVPIMMSNEAEVTGLTMLIGYDPNQIQVDRINTEEGTLLSAESTEYITAEENNNEGVAYIAALKDFATPFYFTVGESPFLPAGSDQLVATLECSIVISADQGFAAIDFVDGIVIPVANSPDPPESYPEVHNVVTIGGDVFRPELGTGGGIDIRRGFIRGDSNKDDVVDISDPTYTLNWAFTGGPAPPCLDAADANNDTKIDISDAIWTLNYLFVGGPQPPEPFPQPGVDPSDDGSGSLGCESD